MSSSRAALKDQAAPLEELLLPAIKLAGLDAVLVAQVGDGLFVHQVGFEDGDLLFGRQTAPLGLVLTVGHVFRSGLSANPNCGKVHFQLRQDSSGKIFKDGFSTSLPSLPFVQNPGDALWINRNSAPRFWNQGKARPAHARRSEQTIGCRLRGLPRRQDPVQIIRVHQCHPWLNSFSAALRLCVRKAVSCYHSGTRGILPLPILGLISASICVILRAKPLQFLSIVLHFISRLVL
jgi:hypothetical protein